MNYMGAFIDAISLKKKVRVTFTKECGEEITRLCAPMDYGHSKRFHDKQDRFHLWDYESESGPHTLSITPNQVSNMIFTEELFCPSEFVTWTDFRWIQPRDWGDLS